MGHEVERWWEPSFAGPTRADRGGCSYRAYIPDPLAGWDPSLSASLMADLGDVQAAIERLGGARGHDSVGDGVGLLILRAEAVASSRIEGLAIGPRRLLEVEALPENKRSAVDYVATEILANVAAMRAAIAVGHGVEPIGIDDILTIHRVLMTGSRHPEIAGRLRTVQNWIGGGSHNPCRAVFVPPPPEDVPGLMDDLVAYLADDSHPPLIQAALAHAQFETIHPFADGNGRTGRALIHVVLRRRGVVTRETPPISVALAARIDEYIAGLTRFRHVGPAGGPGRALAAGHWLAVFAGAARRACEHALAHERAAVRLKARWRELVGPMRADSAAARLIDVLPGAPIVTVTSAARLIDRSTARTGTAINRLEEAGVLRRRELGRRRYRVFEAPAAIDLITDLERALTG